MGRLIDTSYKTQLLRAYEDWFVAQFGKKEMLNVKMVTALLLFSLIPLHDNEKCHQYCNLANSILFKAKDEIEAALKQKSTGGGP